MRRPKSLTGAEAVVSCMHPSCKCLVQSKLSIACICAAVLAYARRWKDISDKYATQINAEKLKDKQWEDVLKM